MQDKSEYLQVGISAVKAAEEVILKYLNEDIVAELKDDMTPVTAADKEAEGVIKQVILKRFPDHTFYGEEGEKVDLSNHRGFTWIIDPIDGTKSFIRKNPMFSTLLALMHDGELVIGISNMPLLHELAYAEKGRGCFVNEQRVYVSAISGIQEAYVSHGSLKLFEKANCTKPLIELSVAARQARGIGDAWSYHLLAQGKIEIMIEADCKLWDIAAAKVLVEEAGGTFTQLDGNPVGPNTITALATNGLLHRQIVERFVEA